LFCQVLFHYFSKEFQPILIAISHNLTLSEKHLFASWTTRPSMSRSLKQAGGNGSAGPPVKQIRYERVVAKKKRTYDQGKTPFQRLLEQPFEDGLEERRVKMATLALKDATDLVEQKLKADQAVDRLLPCAHDVPVLPYRGTDSHGWKLRWRIGQAMVRFLRDATRVSVSYPPLTGTPMYGALFFEPQSQANIAYVGSIIASGIGKIYGKVFIRLKTTSCPRGNESGTQIDERV
jgi:hypothetical protein